MTIIIVRNRNIDQPEFDTGARAFPGGSMHSGRNRHGLQMEKAPKTGTAFHRRVRWKALAVWTAATAISAVFWEQAAHLFNVI
jgi:hypothetical protein